MRALACSCFWRRWIVLAVFAGLALPLSGQENLKVRGLGFWENGRMADRLSFLQGTAEAERVEWDAVRVEDAIYLLLQLLRRQGYPEPEVEVVLTLQNEEEKSVRFGWPFSGAITEEWEVESVLFRSHPGQLAWYESVDFDGLSLISEDEARQFFIPRGGLLISKEQRAFTESNLGSRSGRLVEILRERGHREARLVEREINRREDGGVRVRLEIEEGPRHEVVKVRIQDVDREEPPEGWGHEVESGTVLTTDRLREWRQSLLNDAYRRGFPDARVEVEVEKEGAVRAGVQPVALLLERRWGERVAFGGVSFDSQDDIKESVMRRQADLGDPEVFDVLAVEDARRRLLGLGIFEEVRPVMEESGSGERAVRYELEPGMRQSLTLRVGWGSYERARVGVRWEQRNPFGRAHRYSMEARQSLKASSLQADYSIPHFFDQDLWARARLGYRHREEIDFDRTVREARFSLSRRLWWPGSSVQLAYLLEDVDSDRASALAFPSLDAALVTSMEGRFTLERRNDPLFPTEGYALSLGGKWAAEALGGEANFWKTELAASGHWSPRGSLILHGSVRYGLIQSDQPRAENLPFNERFFPGGERSVRGYQRGEAAPRLADGALVGAESFFLVNAETELRVTDNLSAVLFWDGLWMDRDGAALPEATFLYSVGAGLRWRTLVGPIRLEYGYNPDPRVGDPDGTLHLAVGFPF